MGKKPRILIVEDDADINHLIAFALRKEGFCPEQAFDGIEAISRITNEAFDIVILDIMLPGTDGFQICKRIKSSNPGELTRVLIISALSSPQDKLYAAIMGAESYFSKPFKLSALTASVKEIAGFSNNRYTVSTR